MERTFAHAVRAATSARLAALSVRRQQIAQLRTALQMHKAQNRYSRRQVSAALTRLRGSCTEFRRQVRRQLHAIAAGAAARKSQ
jgi:hypothetical protein